MDSAQFPTSSVRILGELGVVGEAPRGMLMKEQRESSEGKSPVMVIVIMHLQLGYDFRPDIELCNHSP